MTKNNESHGKPNNFWIGCKEEFFPGREKFQNLKDIYISLETMHFLFFFVRAAATLKTNQFSDGI